MRDMLAAIERDPDNPEYLLTLSDIFLSMGLAENCAETLDKVLELEPENTEAMLKLAEIYLLLENYPEAIANADKAIAVDRTNALPHFIKGWTFAEAGDTVNAIKSYLEAIDRKQDYYDAYIQLGLIYSTANNVLAIDYLNNALNIDPQSVEAMYALGMFYQDAGDAETAMTYYNQLLTIDPSNVYATYNLGYIYLVLIGDYEKAIEQFDQALMLKPDYFEALYNKGYCLELLGEYSAARDAYSEVLEMETNYQKAIDGLNRIYNK
jgi:tetratricopeptide (TPR) repeat protein